MFTWFRRRNKAAVPSDRDLFIAALDRLVEAHTTQISAIAEALIAQAKASQAHTDLYRVDTSTAGRHWVMDDLTQYEREQERLKAAGVPHGMSPKEQLQWVLDQSGSGY